MVRVISPLFDRAALYGLHIAIEGLCKKMLEPMTMAEHDNNVFCKQCYARKFGIRGVGFGVGAGALAMDTGDRFGNTESLSYVTLLVIHQTERSTPSPTLSLFLEINRTTQVLPV